MAQLPNEVLRYIFFLLTRPTVDFKNAAEDPSINIKTLMSVSCASKSFNDLSAPALYHNLNMRHSRGVYSMRRFLSTIIRRPERASMTRVLQTSSWQTQDALDAGEPRLTEPATREERDLFISAAYNTILSPKLKWRMIRELQNNIDDAMLALLLLLCVKLEVLVLAIRTDIYGSLVGDVVEEALATKNGCFSHVRDIRGAHCYLENTTGIQHAALLFRLPKLEKFYGWALSCQGANKTEVPATVVSHTMRFIHLQDAIIDAAGFVTLLQAFPDLRTLEVAWGDPFFGTCEVHYEKFGDALRRYGGSMETLKIRDELWVNVQEDEDSDRPLGSLRAMTRLKHLTASTKALFGSYAPGLYDEEMDITMPYVTLSLVEMLPLSLISLTITDEYQGNEQELNEQVHHLSNEPTFKNLRSIIINREERIQNDSRRNGRETQKLGLALDEWE